MLADLPFDVRTAVLTLCGLFFLPHTIAKIVFNDRARAFFHKAGFRPAAAFVALAALMEVTAAIGLVSGLYPRVGAVIGVMVLLGAGFGIVRVHGLKWRWQHPGIEYLLFWSGTMLVAAFLA